MTAAQAAAIQARLSSLSSTDHSRPVLTVAVARFLAKSHGIRYDAEAHWAIAEEADRLISMICAHIMGATQGQFAKDGKQTWQIDSRLREAFSDYLAQEYRTQGDHSEIEPMHWPPAELEPHDAEPVKAEASHVGA